MSRMLAVVLILFGTAAQADAPRVVTAAGFGVYGPAGDWLIPGHGVAPEIVVDTFPAATHDGRDDQLEAAVDHLQRLILQAPRPVPTTPRYPENSKP